MGLCGAEAQEHAPARLSCDEPRFAIRPMNMERQQFTAAAELPKSIHKRSATNN